jgi:hypothetical protein
MASKYTTTTTKRPKLDTGGRPKGKGGTVTQHGVTTTGYQRRCRCEECKAAMTEAHREEGQGHHDVAPELHPVNPAPPFRALVTLGRGCRVAGARREAPAPVAPRDRRFHDGRDAVRMRISSPFFVGWKLVACRLTGRVPSEGRRTALRKHGGRVPIRSGRSAVTSFS